MLWIGNESAELRVTVGGRENDRMGEASKARYGAIARVAGKRPRREDAMRQVPSILRIGTRLAGGAIEHDWKVATGLRGYFSIHT